MLFGFDPYWFMHCGDHSGQGEVFKNIGKFFQKIKERRLIWVKILVFRGYFINWLFRKTTKSMKAPIRFRGWKGKR